MKRILFLLIYAWITNSKQGRTEPGTIIFDEDFTRQKLINNSVWTHEITCAGGGNQEFQYQTNSRVTSQIDNGILFLEPNLTSQLMGKDPLKEGATLEPGSVFPDFCTDLNNWGCKRETFGQNIINPIASAKITTQNSFSFKQGKLEAIAKLPCGDWTWPAIWLLPRQAEYGGWPASGEIDIMESRGNVGAKTDKNKKGGPETFGTTLHWGPRYDQNKWYLTHGEQELPTGNIFWYKYNQLGTFCDKFHVFGLIWTSKSIKVQLDSEENIIGNFDITNMWEKGQFTGKNIWKGNVGAPFDQEFFIMFNVAVGGTFFADDWTQIRPKPWQNSNMGVAKYQFITKMNDWITTWSDRAAAMQIKKITVWANDETEYTYHGNY